jgi:hypothetical protein
VQFGDVDFGYRRSVRHRRFPQNSSFAEHSSRPLRQDGNGEYVAHRHDNNHSRGSEPPPLGRPH